MKRIAAFCLAAAVGAAASCAPAAAAEDGGYEGFLALARCLLVARDRFVETNSVESLAQTAIDGFFAALDPYSRYLTCDEADALARDDRGELLGIGIVASEDPEGVFVNWPLPGSPAFRAGVRMGDLIERVDGVRCTDVGFDAAMDALGGGADGSRVELDVLHEDGARERILVRRSAMRVPTVQSAHVVSNGVAYVAVVQFGETTASELSAAVARLRRGAEPPLRGLVLDLRDNPGGLLDQAVLAAGLFLPAGATVATTRGRVPEEDDGTIAVKTDGPFLDLPLAVLADEGSASAAELVAAALRDAGRAKIVGARTFGKASVQSFFKIPGRPGAQVKLTTAHYYTPSGELIHGRGIEPDIPVGQTRDERWDAGLARIAKLHPELARPGAPVRADAPDRPLEAAVALLSGAEGAGP